MNVIFLTVTIQRSKAGMSPRVEPTKVVEGHSRPGYVMIAGYPVGQTTACQIINMLNIKHPFQKRKKIIYIPSSILCRRQTTTCLAPDLIIPGLLLFSQPVPLRGGLRQRVRIMWVGIWVVGSAVISSSSSSSVSVEEGSSRTCVGVSP